MGIKRKKIITVLGPTASGKSDLAVFLAKKLEGEVVSVDSRQVYQGLDIGSGKITKKEMMAIPHHCLDIASPKRKYTVAQYQKKAGKSIEQILKRNKVPILCGGTAFYIKTLVQGLKLPEVSPDWKLRKTLEKKTPQELYLMLKKKDPERARSIEKDNPRRLIRALEILLKTKKPVSSLKSEPQYSSLFLGVTKTEKKLKKRIEKRLKERLRKGMKNEVQKLKESGLSWKRLESFGLEYQWMARYLQGKTTKQEMQENLLRDIIKFSRKQKSWWKDDKNIHWVKNKKQALSLAQKFLK
jgi:tRNA dimethylallyltransferase